MFNQKVFALIIIIELALNILRALEWLIIVESNFPKTTS